MYKELLLGCGSRREKLIRPNGHADWENLTTVDMNSDHKPDLVWDLTQLPLPFENDYFSEVHAYDVMEHLGQQGDWRFFFAQWSDLYRILKPGGQFFGISPGPKSPWLWGDPGHTRAISEECLFFLHQPSYEEVGLSPMTDYRFVWKGDFNFTIAEYQTGGAFVYGLQAVKPSRIKT